MKLLRYRDGNGQIGYAAQVDERPPRRIAGDIYGRYEVTAEAADVREVLSPVSPVGIFCIGANYRLHSQEFRATLPQRPVVFMKSINTVQRPGGPIVEPGFAGSAKLDYEAELAVVIGKPCRNVETDAALDHVLGYTCANDVSARDWQLEWGEGQWVRGKSFDTFCPLGPCLVTADEIPDPQSLSISTQVNGTTVQSSNTSFMLFSVATLIAFLSQSTTLLPGTVILTGTPEGVGMARKPPLWLKPGDTVRVEIERIGVLENRVEAERDSRPRLQPQTASAS